MKLNSIERAGARPWAVRMLAALVLGALSLAAMAEDDPPGRVGRVSDVEGQVWMLEAGQGEWFELQRNRPFTTGDRIATDANAKVELQIGSTTVRVDEGSDLDVTRLDDDRIDLTLHEGAAAMRVREPEVVPEVSVVTPDGSFVPRAPGLFRIDRSERGSFAGVMQGELHFESKDSELTLRAGQRAEFWLDERDNSTHYTWAQMPNDDFGQWVAREDAIDSRYAVQQRPISAEMTGAEDLDRNGQWDTHPEYGSVWYPTTVSAGWAPYRYGRWTWVRPWGWTWVDDASWGFAPFHYGRWVSWRNRWVWAPGQYVRRPVYAPAMVAWVGGSNASLSITMGGRATPAVGWVPLAPREVYYPSYRTSPVYIQRVNVTKVVIDRDRDRDPRRPIMYTNRGVPGGITVVPRDVLSQRRPVATAQRPADSVVMRQFRDQRAGPDAPPAPANASLAPRVVRTINDVRRDPPPPVNRAIVRRAQDMRDQRDRREPGQAVPTRPGFSTGGNPANRGSSAANSANPANPAANPPRGTTTVPVAPVGAATPNGERPVQRPVERQPGRIERPNEGVAERTPRPMINPNGAGQRPERQERTEPAAAPQPSAPPQRVREPQESPRRDFRQDRDPGRSPQMSPQVQQQRPQAPAPVQAPPQVAPQAVPQAQRPVRELPQPVQQQREVREPQREQREAREPREMRRDVR